MDGRERFIKRYGTYAQYVSVFPDGTEVPWNPLTIGEYLSFVNNLYYSPDEIEDIIFKKCVPDPYFHKDPNLKAGTVSTVSFAILANSSPQTIEELNAILNYHRNSIYSNIIEELVIHVCWAFPSYKIEDVYALDYDTFLKRVAQAEYKLMRSGIIQKPFTIQNTQNIEEQQMQPREEKLEKRLRENKKLREKFEKQRDMISEQQGQKVVKTEAGPVIVSPIITDQKSVVITKDMELAHNILSQNKEESIKMVNETLPIYQDYIDKINNGEKLTPSMIKTIEQKKEEALKRMEKNKEEYTKRLAEERKTKQKEYINLQRKFEKSLNKKQKKKLQK